MIKRRTSPVITWTNIISIVFMLLLVAVLFMPAWAFDDGTLSIAEYVAFPTKKINLLRGFRETLGLAKIPGVNDVVTFPVVSILLAVATVVATWIFRKAPMGSAFALVGSAVALYGYMTVPFFPLAESYTFLLVSSIAAAVVSLIGLVWSLIVIIKQARIDNAG